MSRTKCILLVSVSKRCSSLFLKVKNEVYINKILREVPLMTKIFWLKSEMSLHWTLHANFSCCLSVPGVCEEMCKCQQWQQIMGFGTDSCFGELAVFGELTGIFFFF